MQLERSLFLPASIVMVPDACLLCVTIRAILRLWQSLEGLAVGRWTDTKEEKGGIDETHRVDSMHFHAKTAGLAMVDET